LFAALAISFAFVEWQATARGGPRPSMMPLFHPFTAVAVASVFCHYMLSASIAASRKIVIHLTPAACAIFYLAVYRLADPIVMFDAVLVALGVLGAFGYMRDAWLAGTHEARRTPLRRLRDAFSIPLACALSPFFLWTTLALNPVYDPAVRAFDQKLGWNVVSLADASYRALRPLSLFATACYVTLPIAISLLALKQRASGMTTRVLIAAIGTGVAGFVLYSVCPVIGPLPLLGTPFPEQIPDVGPGDLAPMFTTAIAARNGMPSLHTAWALLIALNVGALGWKLGSAFLLFAAMNVWAAMGLREHWFLDLVVAVPFTAAIQIAIVRASTASPWLRWVECAACVVLTACWLTAVRQGSALSALSVAASRVAVGFTLIVPLLFVLPVRRIQTRSRLRSRIASAGSLKS